MAPTPVGAVCVGKEQEEFLRREQGSARGNEALLNFLSSLGVVVRGGCWEMHLVLQSWGCRSLAAALCWISVLSQDLQPLYPLIPARQETPPALMGQDANMGKRVL